MYHFDTTSFYYLFDDLFCFPTEIDSIIFGGTSYFSNGDLAQALLLFIPGKVKCFRSIIHPIKLHIVGVRNFFNFLNLKWDRFPDEPDFLVTIPIIEVVRSLGGGNLEVVIREIKTGSIVKVTATSKVTLYR